MFLSEGETLPNIGDSTIPQIKFRGCSQIKERTEDDTMMR